MPITEVREPGLAGALGLPDGIARPRAVLALGGSEGGIPRYFIRLLVAKGFACLGLAYVNTPDTQPSLVEVPLERIEKGLRWLRDHPRVNTPDGRVGIVGASKGAELALLVASTFPELVGPVVAYTPSSVAWEGIDFQSPRPPGRSSWSLNGQPVPFVPNPPGVPPASSERGLSFLPIYSAGLDNHEAVATAEIPVERATGPILLISGGDDRVWPANRMCGMIVERLRCNARGQSVRHLNFPEAGHVLFPAGEELASSIPVDFGGGVDAAIGAHASAWPVIVQHLRGAGVVR